MKHKKERRSSAGVAALPDPVVVKVHPAAGGLGRVIEEGEAITHEVRHGVFKGRGTTDGGPGFAVEAVGEAGDLRRGLKFALDLQVNGLATVTLVQRDGAWLVDALIWTSRD